MLTRESIERVRRNLLVGVSFMAMLVLLSSPIALAQDDAPDDAKDPAKKEAAAEEKPCETDKPNPNAKPGDASDGPCVTPGNLFDDDYVPPPTIKEGKRMWARSYRWAKAPDFAVEKWLSEKPDMKGKYVLIEYWATWCGPCRRSIPLLNGFHEKYGDELVVIGISEEPEEDVRKMKEPKIDFYYAVDTKKRMKDELGVWGIPHVIILEPGGYVIWEGFPLLKDYALTDELIDKILAVGRKVKAGSAAAE